MPIFAIRTHLEFYKLLVDDFDDLMWEQHSARRAVIFERQELSRHRDLDPVALGVG
jgi:hypothetical protein